MNCKHDNAYWYSQEKDDYEMRTYDLCFCPDCEEFFEERVFCGRHFHQSKEDYIKNLKQRG